MREERLKERKLWVKSSENFTTEFCVECEKPGQIPYQ
jgi:hypothetical protein